MEENTAKDDFNPLNGVVKSIMMVPQPGGFSRYRAILEALDSVETSCKTQEEAYEDNIGQETTRTYYLTVQESTFKGKQRELLKDKLIKILVEEDEQKN